MILKTMVDKHGNILKIGDTVSYDYKMDALDPVIHGFEWNPDLLILYDRYGVLIGKVPPSQVVKRLPY